MSIYMGVNDVAYEVGISPSTIKKYYLAVEEKGYRFRRNVQGQVMFGEHDVLLFKKIIVLKNQPGMSVQKAIDKVTADITDITIYNPQEDPEPADMTVMAEQFAELKEMFLTIQAELKEIKQEQQASKKLIESQEKPQSEFEEISAMMEKTNQMFMDAMREMAASKERKGFWSKLFK